MSNHKAASMVTCSPGFVYFVGDNNKQKTLGKTEPTMKSKPKDPSSRQVGSNVIGPAASLPRPESRNDKKAFWRRVPPCLAFLAAFSTAMALLLVWSQAAALRRQAFDLNLTKDYILKNLSMDHSDLIRYMREICLKPTTNRTIINATQTWEEKAVMKLTQQKKQGIYLEYLSRIGATSTTAWLDTHMNWTGVIVITDPKSFSETQKTQRNFKTRLIQASLSTDTEVKEISLPQESEVQVTKLTEAQNNLPDDSLPIRIMSFPLYSVLLAYNTTTLDYLNLDGQDLMDLQVLDTIPWDRVKISIISLHWNTHHSQMDRKNVIAKLSNYGYKVQESQEMNKLVFFYNRQLKI